VGGFHGKAVPPSEDLHCRVNRFLRNLSRIHFRHSCFDCDATAFITRPRRAICEQRASINLHGHFRQLSLRDLEIG
jgi:hypothetical protein